MTLLGRRIFLRSPSKVDIVLFDEALESFLLRTLNPKYSVEIFYQRPEDIWIGVTVFVNFIRNIGKLKWDDISSHPLGVFRGLVRHLKLIYFLACLLSMKPKAVVTFVDNSSTFGWLAQNCRKFPFIAIQNGGRLSYELISSQKIYHQHLFCFGMHETRLLPELGWNVENYYPVGSLMASLYFKHPKEETKIKYDLLIASSWRGNIEFTNDVQLSMRSMEVMDGLLANYINSKNIKAAVILRSIRNTKDWYMPALEVTEEEYFKERYGENIEIIENDANSRPVYSAIEESDLIVGYLSTVLSEALGIGKKVQYFNFSGTDLYHKDIHQELVFNDHDPYSFSNKMNQLLNFPQEKQKEFVKPLKKYYMNFSENKPSYQLISSLIDEIIVKHELKYES
jgi:surface carbohydrate biosynthesis protein